MRFGNATFVRPLRDVFALYLRHLRDLCEAFVLHMCYISPKAPIASLCSEADMNLKPHFSVRQVVI